MNLNHLAIFHAVAQAGSMTLGAERLDISQPAVSKQCVCPANRVLDGRGVMPSERRALLWPKVDRAIRAKNSSGGAGLTSGSTVV
jgi:hypothetical protein